MKILVSAFEPFLQLERNITADVLSKLTDELVVDKVLLPVVYEKCWQILYSEIALYKPNFVLMLGQASGRSQADLERVAHNWSDSEFADNAGIIKIEEKIYPLFRESIFSDLPLRKIRDAVVRQGFQCGISTSAGSYVCNDLYFRFMQFSQETKSIRGLFVHLPLFGGDYSEQVEKQLRFVGTLIQVLKVELI